MTPGYCQMLICYTPLKQLFDRDTNLKRYHKNLCGGSGMIYSGSRYSFEFSEFRIQAKIPDLFVSWSNPYYSIQVPVNLEIVKKT